MIFSTFTEETKSYLKSVRLLKDFISFDVYLKSGWNIPKKYTEGVEVLSQDSDREDFKLFAFVVKNERELVDMVEKCVSNIFKYNREREEKERLFKEKVQELKGMFESQDVNKLKMLYFNFDEDTTLELEDNIEDNGQGDGESSDVVQEREVEGQSRGEEG